VKGTYKEEMLKHIRTTWAIDPIDIIPDEMRPQRGTDLDDWFHPFLPILSAMSVKCLDIGQMQEVFRVQIHNRKRRPRGAAWSRLEDLPEDICILRVCDVRRSHASLIEEQRMRDFHAAFSVTESVRGEELIEGSEHLHNEEQLLDRANDGPIDHYGADSIPIDFPDAQSNSTPASSIQAGEANQAPTSAGHFPRPQGNLMASTMGTGLHGLNPLGRLQGLQTGFNPQQNGPKQQRQPSRANAKRSHNAMAGDDGDHRRARQLRQRQRIKEMEDRNAHFDFVDEIEEPLTFENKKYRLQREIVIAQMNQERYQIRDERYSHRRFVDRDAES
jgi:hypothetical protein